MQASCTKSQELSSRQRLVSQSVRRTSLLYRQLRDAVTRAACTVVFTLQNVSLVIDAVVGNFGLVSVLGLITCQVLS